MAETRDTKIAARLRRRLHRIEQDREQRRNRERLSRLNDPQLVAARDLDAARGANGDRLLVKPVFIMSAPRSGSTLLRSMLTCHSKLHAPHELHLRNVQVKLAGRYTTPALAELGLTPQGVQFLLWDRLLHRELLRHGKQVLVNKTPNDVLIWRRILACWPDARFVFLLRNPAAVTKSWAKINRSWTPRSVRQDIGKYLACFDEAYDEHGGLLVRYEDLTEDPELELSRICEFAGVGFEKQMLNYAGNDATHRPGFGDWSANLRSGVVVSRRGDTSGPIPPEFADFAARWGYS